MNQTVTIKSIGTLDFGTNPIILTVERPNPDAEDPIKEALDLGWTVKGIISHLNRDENSNVRNATAAKVASALKENPALTHEEARAIALEAATDYENSVESVRTRSSGAANLGKAVAWILSNAETAKAFTDACIINPVEAQKVAIEMYNAAHPKPVRATEPAKSEEAKA